MKILGISGGNKNGANDCMCKEALLAAKEQVFSILLWTVLDRVWTYPTTLLRTRSQQHTAADGSIQNI